MSITPTPVTAALAGTFSGLTWPVIWPLVTGTEASATLWLVLATIVLVVTIIGIPLAIVLIPVAVLGLAVIGLVGFTAVAFYLGRLVNERFSWNDRNPYLTVITGIVVLISPVLIARLIGLAGGLLFPISGTLSFLGFVVEYLAWTVGFGAVALLRFARPGGSAPVVTV